MAALAGDELGDGGGFLPDGLPFALLFDAAVTEDDDVVGGEEELGYDGFGVSYCMSGSSP